MSWPTITDAEGEAMAERPPESGMETLPLQRYAGIKAELLGVVHGLADAHRSCSEPGRELAAKLEEERFTLAVVGEFKRGKTSLVNALLGRSLLPVGVVPVTSATTAVAYGPGSASVRLRDGRWRTIDSHEIAAYATEAGNPGNAKGVRELRVECPAPLLRNGLELLDTPGVGSIHGHNTDAALAALPRCDAALFVLSADQPLGRAELDFLAEVRGHARRVFFLLNKTDYLGAEELETALAYTRTALAEALDGAEIRLFPVSARLALNDGGWMDTGQREYSGLPTLLDALGDFLRRDKGRLLLLGAAGAAERLLAAARLELEIARRSLAEPPEELEARLVAFRRHRNGLAAERRRLVLDFAARAGRLVETCLDGELLRWRRTTETRLLRRLDARGEALAGQPPRLLDDALATGIAEDVAEAAQAFGAAADALLEAEFGRAARTFAAGAEALLNELQGFAAGLFRLEAPAAKGTLLPEPRGTLLPDAGEDDPAGPELLSELAVLDWPAWLARRCPRLEAALLQWSRRRVLARRRRDLVDTVDLAMGRLRHGYLLRVEEARRHRAEEVLSRCEHLADGMVRALEKGLEERRREAEFVDWRRAALDRQLARLEALTNRLAAVLREAEQL